MMNSVRAVAERPSVVCTVTNAVYRPFAVYTRVVLLLDVVASTVPSPSKSHAKDCATPPATVAVNVTVCPCPATDVDWDAVRSMVSALRGVTLKIVDTVLRSLSTSVAVVTAEYVAVVQFDEPL
jgi:hypothetical protein